MTNIEVFIHDAAEALSSLPASMPNKLETFKRTLESLVRLAKSEYELELILKGNNHESH